jgi:hypothetical protein
MGLERINKAIQENDGEENKATWAVGIRFDLTNPEQKVVAESVKKLMAKSGMAAGPLIVELLDEVLKTIDLTE